MKRLLPLLLLFGCAKGPEPFIVGSKTFTESEIMGEIIAQLAEKHGATVERKFYMGGVVLFRSLQTGALDAYVEYTGTGLVSLLNEPASSDQEKVYTRVKDQFKKKWDLTWTPPLGFNNSYSIALPRKVAERLGAKKLSDLKGAKLRCGFDEVFLDRPDGYKGMVKHYGFAFCSDTKQMNSGLMYQAASTGEVDAISSYTTDGRIATLDLVVLEDDKEFFPPYHAAVLVGPDAFKKVPALEGEIEKLAGKITDADMVSMNAEVDQKKRPAKEVAAEFLQSKGLL